MNSKICIIIAAISCVISSSSALRTINYESVPCGGIGGGGSGKFVNVTFEVANGCEGLKNCTFKLRETYNGSLVFQPAGNYSSLNLTVTATGLTPVGQNKTLPTGSIGTQKLTRNFTANATETINYSIYFDPKPFKNNSGNYSITWSLVSGPDKVICRSINVTLDGNGASTIIFLSFFTLLAQQLLLFLSK